MRVNFDGSLSPSIVKRRIVIRRILLKEYDEENMQSTALHRSAMLHMVHNSQLRYIELD